MNESKSHTTHTRQEMKLTSFRLRSPMHLNFGLYVGYTQWGVYCTHLKNSTYEHHSPNTHKSFIWNVSQSQ
jgi:hypothetical protein